MEVNTSKSLLEAIKSLEARIEEHGGSGRPVVQKELIGTIQELASHIQDSQLRMKLLNITKEFTPELEESIRR